MLVTALMETDLARALKKDASMSGGRRITWEPRRGGRALRVGLARRIALDVARGLAFLHGRKVCSPHGFLGLVQELQLFVARKRMASQGGVWATGRWIRVMRGHAFASSYHAWPCNPAPMCLYQVMSCEDFAHESVDLGPTASMRADRAQRPEERQHPPGARRGRLHCGAST